MQHNAAQRSAAQRSAYVMMPLYAYVASVSIAGDDTDTDAAPRRTMSMSGDGLTHRLTDGRTSSRGIDNGLAQIRPEPAGSRGLVHVARSVYRYGALRFLVGFTIADTDRDRYRYCHPGRYRYGQRYRYRYRFGALRYFFFDRNGNAYRYRNGNGDRNGDGHSNGNGR